jgi:ribosomal protein L40E
MGAAGTSVTVLGSGFSSADTSCTIASNIVEGGYTCNMNNAGDVSGSFIVNGPPGTYNIEVIGSTGDSANVPFTFTSTQEVTTSTQPAPDFTINVSPPSQWVLQGQAVLYSVNVVALNGFNSQVSLSVSGLPSGANGVFSNPFGTPNFVSALTVTMPSDASTGTYALTVTGNGGGLTHVANIVLTVNAATAPSTTSTTVPQTTGQVDWPPLLVAIVLLAAVLVWVALRRRREPTPTSTQPTKADRTTGMVYCGKCGTQNPAANDFCRKCGTKLN